MFEIKFGIFALKNLETCSPHSECFSSLAIFFVAVLYSSGTSIASFPSDGLVIKQKLNHQGNEVVTGETKIEEDVAVLGLYQVPGPTSGRIVLYGDSNCLDNAHMEKGTRHYWFNSIRLRLIFVGCYACSLQTNRFSFQDD